MRRLFVVFLIFVFSLSAWAAAINIATVTVPDRSKKALQEGMRTALSQVVVQMSGNAGITTLPAVQSAISDASSWVQDYTYQPTSDGSPGLTLQVTFDKAGLDELLRKSGQVVWRKNRPLTLVYFDENNADLRHVFQETAKTDGLTIIFPVMDLADQNIVDPNAGTISESTMSALGKRYGVDSVLAAHFVDGDGSNNANQFRQIHWIYCLNGKTYQWTTTDATSQAMMVTSVYRLLQILQGAFAENATIGTHASIKLSLNGIRDMDDLIAAIRELKKINLVKSAQVDTVGSDRATIILAITGDVDELKKSLADNAAFSPVITAAAPASSDETLRYFWTKSTS